MSDHEFKLRRGECVFTAADVARQYRIEWFGTLQVHQPVKEQPLTVHQAATEVGVSCA